jgi:hypothetical protein
MLELKQSTSVNVLIGPAIDITDVTIPLTGLTIHPADIHLSKNGSALADKSEASNCTQDGQGYYICSLNTTDTNTLGRLQLVVVEATAFPIYAEYMVVTANYYDTKYSTDYFDVNVVSQANIDFGALQKTSLNAATPALSAASVDSILDEVVEGATTLRQATRLSLAMLSGKSSGGGSNTLIYRDIGDTKARVTFTTDANKNRTAVTRDTS